MSFATIYFRRFAFAFDRPYVMAVINVTPDSFSDGGRLANVEQAVAHGLACVAEGADCLDIGGESTRPGAAPVSFEEEIARVVPVIERLASCVSVPIAVDTTKVRVAEAALVAGAEIINDISGGFFEPDITQVAEKYGAAYICGHVRGRNICEVHEATPPRFEETCREIAARLGSMPASLRVRTFVDPGLGFGKGRAENLELLRRVRELAEALGRPVLVGPSRKRFLGALTGRDVSDRDAATVGACLAAVACGAHVLRVHAVKPVRDALCVFQAVVGD